MKLKYYLRGIGLGIIFATIIMTVSSLGHKTTLSKEEIIAEATKLGMIMPNTQLDSGKVSELKESQQQESQEVSEFETQQLPGAQVQSEKEDVSDSQTQQEQQEIVLKKDMYKSSHGGKVTIYKSTEHPTTEILINVKKGATSEDVAEVLYECGYIESVESFNTFMSTHAYNKKVLTGDSIIQAGATYEEIAHILLTQELEN